MEQQTEHESVLSLDTAKLCGWCIMKNGNIIDYNETDLGRTTGEQLHNLWKLIDKQTKKYHITDIVAENIFNDKNETTYSKLSKYQGIIQLYAYAHNIRLEIKEYLPTQWKRTLLSKPYATKTEVLSYIKRNVDTNVTSDNVADAIAIALTWYKRKYIQQRR
jgi:Holliday junction resolvasome RuvABC endonuclease subunit